MLQIIVDVYLGHNSPRDNPQRQECDEAVVATILYKSYFNNNFIQK